jgi:F-type H+-transporting ATPase subunit b
MNKTVLNVAVVCLLLLLPMLIGASPAGGEERSVIPSPREAIIPAVTTLVVFALLLAVLGKYAWGPIASGLKAREDKIRQDIRNAEEARARAEATLGEYNQKLAAAENEVRQIMAKASADAERLATSFRMQAQQEAEEIKERAQRDIEASKNQALSEIYEKAAELSTSIAEKILRRNINVEDQRDLVNESLRQLQEVN